ncbi:MAG: tetratricopeptide repeat protein [Candidatus Omnitrophica bacterium]|nr:tetratricopeptide repeat protein [Candidatus Omnitrophota bacterium]
MREKVIIFLFFLGVILSVTHTLWAYDVWWHLKTGEWIWKHHAIPRIDLFSYTVSTHPWIDLSWFFQLLIYFFYKLLGINGIIFFKVFIATLTFFLLFRFFYRKIEPLLLLPILSLTLWTAHERLVERPEVLSFLLLVITLLILEKERRGPTKRLFLLPLLQILWVNSHSLFIFGLLAIGAFCVGEICEKKSFPARLLLFFLLSSAATLVNPYGVKGSLFPLTLYSRISGEIEIFTAGIGEFTRPLATYDASITLLLYKTLLLLTSFSFLLNHKRFSYSHGVLFLIFAFLSLLARRNIAPFSFVCCFLLLKNLEGLSHERLRFLEGVKTHLLFSLTLLLPLPFVTNAFYVHEGLHKRFGLGVSEHRYCIQAANFIAESDLPGNFFNSGLDVGNYLIWRLYPERKVFMDGRLEVYGASFFQELFHLFNVPAFWPKWVEKYNINFCILDHTIQKQANFLRWLSRDAEWVPIYLDEQIIIFMKKSPENRPILHAHAIDLAKDPIPLNAEDSTAELRLADFYGKMGIVDKAEVLYRKNLSRSPRSALIYHNLGNLLRQQGKLEEALSAYRQAVALQPTVYLFRYSLGVLYTLMGKEDLALKEFKESVRLNPHFGESRFQLGRLYASRKQWLYAEKEYRRVSPFDAAYLSAHNALGILYAEKGELEKAEKEFKDILKVNPYANETVENLKRVETLKVQ